MLNCAGTNADSATTIALRVFTCGGTIDKIYFDAHSDYQVGEPNISGVFAQMRVGLSYQVTELMRKDSIDMNNQDRQRIREAVQACAEDYILVTHGTDTLVDTAQALLGIPGKRVVLTGAMLPATMRDSDAVFNVGFALGVLLAADSAHIMVAMNGQVFHPQRVRKNRQAGRFEGL